MGSGRSGERRRQVRPSRGRQVQTVGDLRRAEAMTTHDDAYYDKCSSYYTPYGS